MADRRIFDRTRSGAGEGRKIGSRYVVNIDASKADRVFGSPSAAGFSRASGGVPVPEATVRRGKLRLSAGAERFAAARDMGMRTVPVAMSMAAARAARKQGLIADARYGGVVNSRKGDPRDYLSTNLFIQVDLTDMNRLAEELNARALVVEKGHFIISRAINYGMDRFRTKLRRKLKSWTGIKWPERLERGFGLVRSTPALMHATLRMRDRHIRITEDYFGARWSRQDPGATHKAWNRSQLAVGSFMIPGKMPIFKRVTANKYPIAPLWGPNVVREIERHRPEVNADLAIAGEGVRREAVRLLRVAVTGSGKK